MIAALSFVFGFASCKTDDDPTYYTVTIASTITNGSVSANKTSAVAGDTVKLTATPADGYTLDSFSVTDANTNAITVTNGAFTMPASNVTVSATFKQTTSGGDDPTKYTVTIASGIENGTVTANPTSAAAGETITLTATPSTGYQLATLTVQNGTADVTVTNNAFTMPAGNVTVSATFTALPPDTTTYTVRHLFQKTDASGYEQNASYPDETKSGTIGAETQAEAKTVTGFTAQSITQATIAASGTTVEIKYDRNTYTVTFNADDGSTVTTQTVRYGATATKPENDPTKEATATTRYTFAGWYNGDTEFDFATPITDDITLKAKWTETAIYTVSIASGITNGSVTASPTTATAGTTITLSATPDSGYQFTAFSVTDASNNAVTVTNNTFTMPASNVTVSATFTELEEVLLTTITATATEQASYSTEGVATVSFAGSSSYAANWGWYTASSATITVTAASDGYTITRVKFFNGNNTAFDEAAPFQATLGSRSVVVGSTNLGMYGVTKIEVYGYAASAGNTHTVTLTGGANATTSGGNTTQEGLSDAMETVTFTANDGYYFEDFTDITNNGITATRTSDTTVTVSGTPTGNASITIPDATEQQATTYSITLTYQYSDFTFVMEYQEGDKWNDMATKYPDYIKIDSSYVEFQSYGQICDKATGNKVSPTDEIDPNKTYEIQ